MVLRSNKGMGPKRSASSRAGHITHSEHAFSQAQLATVILGIGVLSTCLCLFRRGPSRVQPPEAIAGALRFISRHTLVIYAIQLAASELVKKLLPDLVP